MLVIEKFPGTSAVQVTEDIEAALKDMEPGLTGVQIDTTVFRPATAVQDSVSGLGLALLISLLIAVGLFWLLFRSWRVAVIALAAITTTVVTAAVVLYAQNATLNVTVLVGLVLAMSVIVGDIVEDVQAQRRRPMVTEATETEATLRSRIVAAVRGVRTPLFQASLIMVVALIPTLFVSGIGGSFFTPLFWSVVLALSAGLLVGLSVTPVLAHMLLPRETAPRKERAAAAVPGRTTIGRFGHPFPPDSQPGRCSGRWRAWTRCRIPVDGQPAGGSDPAGQDLAGPVGLHGRHVQ